MKVIGIHCSGSEAIGLNYATILGQYGNQPDVFLSILKKMEKGDKVGIEVAEMTLIDGSLKGKRIDCLSPVG